MRSVIVTCGVVECRDYKGGCCMAGAVDHSTDGICITWRRKVEAECKELMRNDKPIDFELCGK